MEDRKETSSTLLQRCYRFVTYLVWFVAPLEEGDLTWLLETEESEADLLRESAPSETEFLRLPAALELEEDESAGPVTTGTEEFLLEAPWACPDTVGDPLRPSISSR